MPVSTCWIIVSVADLQSSKDMSEFDKMKKQLEDEKLKKIQVIPAQCFTGFSCWARVVAHSITVLLCCTVSLS